MKKNLTISIAAYNVEKYIEETLSSLVCENMDLLEVLIIDDGSKDKTYEISKEFEKKYKGVFKVIKKSNGGYGSTINVGIEYAHGKYFKQLDGDDKYDTSALNKFLIELNKVDTDIIYNPFVIWTKYENNIIRSDIENKKKSGNELNYYLSDIDCDLAMHSLCYKTSLLKKNNVKILENSFYTDTEYALYPFIYSNTIKVFTDPLYMYRMGDEGQSVSLNGMRKHYLDFEKVIKSIINNSEQKVNELPHDSKKDYIIKKVDNIICTAITNLIVALPLNINNYKYIKNIDKYVKEHAEIYYVNSKLHKSVYVFRKGNFLVYSLLHIYLLIKLKLKK